MRNHQYSRAYRQLSGIQPRDPKHPKRTEKRATSIRFGFLDFSCPPVYFVPRMASLAALATRNFTTRLALIWIVSPVAGLRPMRGLRSTSTSLPRPGRVKVFLAFL